MFIQSSRERENTRSSKEEGKFGQRTLLENPSLPNLVSDQRVVHVASYKGEEKSRLGPIDKEARPRTYVYTRAHIHVSLYSLKAATRTSPPSPLLLPLKALALRYGNGVCIANDDNASPLHCPGPLSFRGISLDTSGKRTNVWEKKRLDAACIYIYIYRRTSFFLFHGPHGRT